MTPRLRFANGKLGSPRAGLSVPAPTAPALAPLLAEAVVLLRASQHAGGTGDDWVNEGTAGAAYNATAVGDTDPTFVTSPEPGFVCGNPPETEGVDVPPHLEVADGAAIDITTGSFAVAWRGLWTATAQGAFEPFVAKLTGSPGVDGHGWVLVDGSNIGGAGVVLANEAAFAGGLAGAPLGTGEHLVVASLDRTGDLLSFYVDGVGITPADASAVTTVSSTNPIVIGRTVDREQTVRDIVVWDRALTEAEATVTLPAALGV